MGLFFNHESIEKASNFRKFIRNYSSMIEKTFQKCKVCEGTGLAGFTKSEQGCSWNGEWCPVCKGTGYVDWEKSKLLAICDCCNGSGGSRSTCSRCNGKGVVDWVTAMRLGITCGGIGIEE